MIKKGSKAGRISGREMQVLYRSWEILSEWTQIVEDAALAKGEDPDEDPLFGSAMNAVVGLCEFIGCYEG